jgi:hypothetical protein
VDNASGVVVRRTFDPDRGMVRETDDGEVLLERLETHECDDEPESFNPRKAPPVRTPEPRR